MGKRLRLGEVAKRHGRSQWWWRTRCDKGEIPHIREGNQRLIDEDDIDGFVSKKLQEGLR